MNDNPMYNEVPVVGEKYNFGDWKKYAVHNDKEIKGFFGDYRWLSNFEACNVWFEGEIYGSSETAYQASKIIPASRSEFALFSPSEAKKKWKNYILLYDSQIFDGIKNGIMAQIVFQKFYQNPVLRQKLLKTKDKYLEETNHWGDIYWGVSGVEKFFKAHNRVVKLGEGENNLGKILMKIREFWK